MSPSTSPQEHEQSDELSFGHDPDLIARYLAGEQVVTQLREMERDEGAGRGSWRADSGSVSHLADFRIDAKQSELLEPPASAPTPQEPPKPPTLALIALGVALAVFALSIWIALR
jgi:hypothetical protein